MVPPPPASAHVLRSPSGLTFELLEHGAVRRAEFDGVALNLFVGNVFDGAPANLWLRVHAAGGCHALPLLGPASASRVQAVNGALHAAGEAHGLRWRVAFVLARTEPAWFRHVQVDNAAGHEQTVDLLWVQDVALTTYGAVRLNEHYVSHYVDFTPLAHPTNGQLLAARQNLAVGGRHPWGVFGSLRRAVAYATDSLQVFGLATRAGAGAPALRHGLPAARLQHEHACIALQDAPVTLAPGARFSGGFFGLLQGDHPQATGTADVAFADRALALPEAAAAPAAPAAPATATPEDMPPPAPSLFASAPWFEVQDLRGDELAALFGPERRHEETAEGVLQSFFCGRDRHVVLRAKELRTMRPHGHILRTGAMLVPDETALTSTVWMAGVFHSMVTQGHVSIHRFLSTVHGWLGLFRSHGQRIFVQAGGPWQQLGVPSAFEIEPDGCRWFYRHAAGLFVVRSRAAGGAHALELNLEVLAGGPLRLLVTHHVALGGDDGTRPARLRWQRDGAGVFVAPPEGSELAQAFPGGGFAIEPAPGTTFARVGDDALVFADGRSRAQPLLVIEGDAAPHFGLRIGGRLIDAEPVPSDAPLPVPRLHPNKPGSAAATQVARLSEILPWFTHNALVHYLAPRGLEQYSGGGWGTRDVCQGPLEMLLACGRTAPARDLLLRTFGAQNADGDWPQWFMFFDRQREIRAADSHGDIVYWPPLALARYLLASGDAAVLDERIAFHDGEEPVALEEHVQRALQCIATRRIAGTWLAAYGHGDWNDALQPADPGLRERMCSAWTVTLHHQVLATLARALHTIGRHAHARPLEQQARQVHADFQRLLLRDGVVAGYAVFPQDVAHGGPPALLLHPSDTTTGVHYSLLPMMHAILEDLLTPEQAHAHLALIRTHLTGPDGARLFDAPLPYRGGPQRIFQRAESSAFFGREIGLMYMHAHLRYAEALAHVGDAAGFHDALARAHPVGIAGTVPGASARQANCYYSSSDAAFPDRYAAAAQYARVAAGAVALDGGWRVYSSGPGIALALVWRHVVGLAFEHDAVVVDPVLPRTHDGLRVDVAIDGLPFDVELHAGPAGCGPVAVTLNGRPLPFTRRGNPYRTGAAAVARAEFDAARVEGRNVLVIRVG